MRGESRVETAVRKGSPFQMQYRPDEKIPVIVVDNFPRLGELVAARFIEWVQSHPGGVISLPTGKTPEHFIRWVEQILQTWGTHDTNRLLERWSIDPARKPDLRSLHFVQIDEFYPIDPTQHNSFFHYVNTFYMGRFGLDRKKALLIDCSRIGLKRGQTLSSLWPEMRVDLSLRTRRPVSRMESAQKTAIGRIDDWCRSYEDRVVQLGGIGFFLGGIGPDGHIGFNCRGSSHRSITRLAGTNYETQAAAAGDLGGIETSRQRLVITIGLKTITRNRACTALIMAAGEAKAPIVADAIHNAPSPLYPATVLQGLPNARFYVTMGAAKHLTRRRVQLVKEAPSLSQETIEKIVVDMALALRKPVAQLTQADFRRDRFGAVLLTKQPDRPAAIRDRVHESLVRKITRGCRAYSHTSFLHTEPHHDDLLLGCLPAILGNAGHQSNAQTFATLTSGFNAVTNGFMLNRLATLNGLISDAAFVRAVHDGNRDTDTRMYLDALAEDDDAGRARAVAGRLLRCLEEVEGSHDVRTVRKRIVSLIRYFEAAYPGKKDPPDVQLIKGMCREWEAECLWCYFGWMSDRIHHLRLAFYKGDIFTEEPMARRDVPPILNLLRSVKPNIVSVAFDPEASGPDTHFKVMQAIHAALEEYGKEVRTDALPRVWGYRNVWYHFHPSEANLFMPVPIGMLSLMNHAFMNTFSSQETASFPSHEYDGPFCRLAQRYQVDKYRILRTCLGEAWFRKHPDAAVRAAHGFVFMKEMTLKEFFKHSRALRKQAEGM